MLFTQYYLDCLSQASYLIADDTHRAGRASSTRAATSTSTSPTPRRTA